MKHKLLLTILLFGTCALGKAQTQSPPSPHTPPHTLPEWLHTPITPTQQERDSVTPELRRLRGESYLREGEQSTPLDDTSVALSDQRHSMSFRDYLGPIPPFPAKDSDLVVFGTTSDLDQFLTPDHRHIYDELTIKPIQIFKQDRTAQVSAITVRQEGGVLKLPSNKIAIDPPPSGSFPLHLKTPYLLFLKYLPQTQDYAIVSVWDMREEKARLLGPDGLPQQPHALAMTTALSHQELFAEVETAVKTGGNR